MKPHTQAKSAQDIDAVIAQARKLVAQARKTVDETQRRLAQQGFDIETVLADIRRLGGEAAVQRAQAEVDEAMRAIEDEVQRSRNASSVSKPVTKRLALRGGRI